MNSRDEFFSNIRQALGRTSATPSVVPTEVTALSQDAQSVEARVELVRQYVEANATELMSQLQDSATLAGWKVKHVPSIQDAAITPTSRETPSETTWNPSTE